MMGVPICPTCLYLFVPGVYLFVPPPLYPNVPLAKKHLFYLRNKKIVVKFAYRNINNGDSCGVATQ